MECFRLRRTSEDEGGLCPVCKVQAQRIGKFQCVHCNTEHTIYECPECKNWVIVPDYIGEITIV